MTIRRTVLMLLATIFLLYSSTGLVVAYTDAAVKSFVDQTPFYDPDKLPPRCAGIDGNAGASTSMPNENQIKNAKIVMGIAKTNNMGKDGALIGLMVGLAESHLQNYANSGMSVSKSFPNEGLGGDFDSVGIFQQRVVTGWSTLAPGNGPASQTPSGSQQYSNGFPDAVRQIMTPEYAAQAFFGSPPGSGAPPALSKGLQNKSSWQSKDPALVAQEVQGSFDGTGSNYRRYQAEAQKLINLYWESSPAIPLPVAVKAGPGGASGSGSAGCGTIISGDVKLLAQQILDNPNISYPLDGSSPNGSTKAVLEALAKGQPAPVACRDGSAGSITTTDMNPNVLKFVLELGKQGFVGVNALSDKCHSSGSNHYKGMAVDFECGSVPFDPTKGDVAAGKYGLKRNSETCAGENHWHYDAL